MFSVLDFTILPLLLAKVVEVFNFMTLMKIKIDNITINGITYSIVDGGTKCSDCQVKDICINQGFANGVNFDCTSVHLNRI